MASNHPVSEHPVPGAELVATLSDGTKVKRRLPRMRACNEKKAGGKICAGHLKRSWVTNDEVDRLLGKNAELYRCEKCRTIYLPNPDEKPRSGTLSY
jgi:hypothetical protein